MISEAHKFRAQSICLDFHVVQTMGFILHCFSLVFLVGWSMAWSTAALWDFHPCCWLLHERIVATPCLGRNSHRRRTRHMLGPSVIPRTWELWFGWLCGLSLQPGGTGELRLEDAPAHAARGRMRPSCAVSAPGEAAGRRRRGACCQPWPRD